MFLFFEMWFEKKVLPLRLLQQPVSSPWTFSLDSAGLGQAPADREESRGESASAAERPAGRRDFF
jgi:hypothetical protein